MNRDSVINMLTHNADLFDRLLFRKEIDRLNTTTYTPSSNYYYTTGYTSVKPIDIYVSNIHHIYVQDMHYSTINLLLYADKLI